MPDGRALYRRALRELAGLAQMPPPERLDRNPVAAALRAAGSPHRAYRRAQVIGTNGKGSAAFFLARILGAQGLRCGLYTSPHLVDIRERIVCGGKMISRRDFGQIYKDLSALFERYRLTHFERLTLLAAEYFRRAGAEFAVLETGIGGAGDAVSALRAPDLLYTSISLEHADMLGPTVRAIARKKAGPLASAERAFVSGGIEGAAADELRKAARASGAELSMSTPPAAAVSGRGTEFSWRGGKLSLLMTGAHYAANAALALDAAAGLLGARFGPAKAARALAGAFWPGRLQYRRLPGGGRLLLSCAHNPESLEADIAALRSLRRGGGAVGTVVLAGFSGPRDGKPAVKRLRSLGGEIFLTRVPGHEAAYGRLRGLRGVKFEPEPVAALTAARKAAGRGGTVLVCGSIYLAGEVLRLSGARAALPG